MCSMEGRAGKEGAERAGRPNLQKQRREEVPDIENHEATRGDIFGHAEEGDLYLATQGPYVVVGIDAGRGAMKHFSPDVARDFALNVLRSADAAEAMTWN